MPLYEYQCVSCENRFEKIQKFSDPPVEACPSCGGGVKKLLSSPAIQFKGSGWYITDYAKKKSSDGSKSDGAKAEKSTPEGGGEKSGESSKTDGSQTGSAPTAAASATAKD